MTSATVTQLGEMLTNINASMGNTETQTGEFAGIFQTAAEKSGESSEFGKEPAKVTATEKTVSTSKRADNLREHSEEKETAVSQKTEATETEPIEKELEAATEELKEEIAEKLDITMEELEAAMETLGLTDASLFTQEGMTALVMEVEQLTTPVELLTNANAYEALQELTAVASEILEGVQQECGLNEVQMQEALEQFAKNVEADVKAEEVIQDVSATNDELEVPEEKPIAETNSENASEDVSTVKENTSVENAGNDTSNTKHEHGAEENRQAVVSNNPLVNNTQTVNQTVTDFSQNIPTENISAQEIYDQIGEYIKSNIRPGVSEVEMQLNPENLGSLHIHLSSKQGNVTAQFTVQNELVKAALEVQLIQLKENFAEQGIKVDAVEVTVESHAFNENMQQSNEENAQAQAEAKRPGIRSINLNGGWAEEELTEEEQLVAEMMAADGNSVDYKA